MSRSCFALLTCLVLLPVAGCGGNGNLRVYPVSGTITFEGEPMVGGGSIAFVPIGTSAESKGKAPGGQIDDSGNYVLSTYTEGDGSIAGEFRVIITQETAEEMESTPDGTAPPTQSQQAVPEKLMIPVIYSDFTNSPLKATVEAKEQEINFDLKRVTNAETPRPANVGA